MKLCPICDNKLSGNFCPVCKRSVREPLIVSDGIHLNESHYGMDKMCEYHKYDRHVPILNESHDPREKECSYHDPDTYNEEAGRSAGVNKTMNQSVPKKEQKKSSMGSGMYHDKDYFLKNKIAGGSNKWQG